MNRLDTIRVLNRLLRTLCRSMPRYVTASRLWTRDDVREALEVLGKVAADQETQAARVAEAIRERRGPVEIGHFATSLTGLNDVAAAYIAKHAIEYQARDIETIRACRDELNDHPELRSLADEILESAQGHLETLEQLAADAQPVSR
jgi:hypothetical protein